MVGGIREFAAEEDNEMETKFSFEAEEMTNWRLVIENRPKECEKSDKQTFKISLSCESGELDKKTIKNLYLISRQGKSVKLESNLNKGSLAELSLPAGWPNSKAKSVELESDLNEGSLAEFSLPFGLDLKRIQLLY